jgi:hypothetical protein
MPGFISDSHLARELIRIGDEAIATEDDTNPSVFRGRLPSVSTSSKADRITDSLS